MKLSITCKSFGMFAYVEDGANKKRDAGYSCHDVISTMFRVVKTMDILSEHAKLEYIRASIVSV
jgi:Replication factor C C-terminal domain